MKGAKMEKQNKEQFDKDINRLVFIRSRSQKSQT